jgi:hypothetical protein
MVHMEQQLWPSSDPIMETIYATDCSDSGVLGPQGPLWPGSARSLCDVRRWLRRYGITLVVVVVGGGGEAGLDERAGLLLKLGRTKQNMQLY